MLLIVCGNRFDQRLQGLRQRFRRAYQAQRVQALRKTGHVELLDNPASAGINHCLFLPQVGRKLGAI
jgi:hypothetical protein